MVEKAKRIVKLAVIRKQNSDPCPFGLDITNGCRNAGELIVKMAPLDSLSDVADKNAVKKANRRLYMWNNPGQRCAYAGKLIPEKAAVECNYGSNAPGITEKGVVGPPFYSKVYNNIGLDGIFSYPLGYYADNNISRNLFYGQYSLMGSDVSEEDIKKFAEYLSQLDAQFDKLSEEDRDTLKRFANNYANNSLFKQGTPTTDLDEITIILERWKDTDESS